MCKKNNNFATFLKNFGFNFQTLKSDQLKKVMRIMRVLRIWSFLKILVLVYINQSHKTFNTEAKHACFLPSFRESRMLIV